MNQILVGDCRNKLSELEDKTFDCCITSPPYYKLRSYFDHPDQIGQEDNFKDYIQNLLSVFKQVKRVLKDDGTVWVVLGDTFNGNKRGNTNSKQKCGVNDQRISKQPSKGISKGSLMLIPTRFAEGMVDNLGYTLRNIIPWRKANAFPNAAKNRFAIDWEYVFFFTKQPTGYYFKQQYEPYAESTLKEIQKAYTGKAKKIYENTGYGGSSQSIDSDRYGGRLLKRIQIQNPSDAKRSIIKSVTMNVKFGGVKHEGYGNATYSGKTWTTNEKGRVARAWFTINTKPYLGNFFAAFPPKLVEKCLAAGCRESGLVLDPFAGVGTVGLVARQTGRDFCLIELTQQAADQANARIQPLLLQSRLM